MKKHTKSIFCTLTISFCACIAFAAAPSWLKNIESVYPDSKYLATSSSGSTALEAKQNALIEIASYFGSTVSSSVQAKTTATQTAKGNETETTKERSMTESLNIVSDDVDLFGLEYSDVYHDKKSKKYYVVAFIDRRKACAQFIPKLENIRLTFSSFYEDGYKNLDSDPFTALKNFISAEKVADALESGINYLRVIDREISRDYDQDAKNVAAMKKQKDDAIRNSTLFVEFPGDVDNIITNAVKKPFAEKGFVFTDNKANAFYILNGNINDNLQKETDYGTVYVVNPTVTVSVNRKSDGKTVYSENSAASKKTTNIEEIPAKKRAYPEIAESLGKKIGEYLQ